MATGTENGPRPAPGRRHSGYRDVGFTLVEVLVVVAIAGVLVAVAAVNLFPGDVQVARGEAANVALAVEHARDAAWFGGRPTAITLGDGRLREWRLAGDAWSAGANDRALPGDLRVTAIHVDGQALDPRERLLFLPDGLGVPFRIALDIRGQPWAVEGDAAGAVRVLEP
ncbi:MAG TPA: GspH/FimT family pseudopilin [Usitatibacter sp.]|nr:GspH/FimT family pseudopilin [Usitatibacter sp.]